MDAQSLDRSRDVSGRLYLVTGARGFVGAPLCSFLQERGHRVRALVRRPKDGPWDETFVCDLAEEDLPASLMEGVDGVFHLAGIAHMQDISRGADDLYRRVNMESTVHLLDAASRCGVGRFVYFSSVKAVADPGARCVDESWDEPAPEAYGRSKREAEQRVLEAGRNGGMHVCNLRPALLYGPGVKGNLARMIEAIERGRFPPLPECGNRRSMVGLVDLIEAAWSAMHDPRAAGRTYIVSDGIDYSTRVLYTAISEALGHPVPSWTLPFPILRAAALVGNLLGRVTRRPMPLSSAVVERLAGWACYSAERIRKELGWTPRQTFSDVLPAMVAARETTAVS